MSLAARALSIVIAAAGLASCATMPDTPPAYAFNIADEPQNLRIVLTLTSHDSRALCISSDNWMSVERDGQTVENGAWPLVTAAGALKPLHMTYSDAGMVCGRSGDPDCGMIRLEPGAEMRTELPYRLYGDPDTLAADTSKHFDLGPNYLGLRVCKTR